MEVPKDFFTLQSMLTLSGSTGATFVICNGLQQAFNFNPKWLGLVVAQTIVFVGVYVSGGQTIIDYFIGAINGFLVFCSAAGATGALGQQASIGLLPRGGATAKEAGIPVRGAGRRFLTSWF